MHQTSELYQQLWRDPHHWKETRVNIAGADYGQDHILSLATYGGAFSEPDIGTCASRQVDLVLHDPGAIPWNAEMRVFVRLTLGGQVSEWLPKGVFFIASRKRDAAAGTLEIHGFDAMLRANGAWEIDPYANWPMPQRDAAADIAWRMGVELDPRTVIAEEFPVEYPAEETAMIDVLEGIAVSNAGNWVMSDEGKLLLLRYGDIPPETSCLVTEYGDAITFGGVKILVG